MYWICRRRPSCARMPRAVVIASTSRSGRSSSASRFGVERDQRLAQVLQRVHRVLAPGLGRGLRRGRGVRRRGIGAGHRVSGGKRGGRDRFQRRSVCYDNRPTPARLRVRPGKAAADGRAHPDNDPSMTTTLKPGKPAAVPHGAAGSGAHSRHFPVATADLERVAAAVLDAARKGGATSAETEVSQGDRPERHRAPRRGRDDLVQPRQGRQRHRLRRAAARQCEHGRFLRRVHRRDRRQGDRDRALHGRGSGGGSRGPGAPRARVAGPRSLSSVGPARGNGDRAGPRDRSRGARRGPAHHEQRGRDGRAQRIGVRLREFERASRAATAVRATTSIAR